MLQPRDPDLDVERLPVDVLGLNGPIAGYSWVRRVRDPGNLNRDERARGDDVEVGDDHSLAVVLLALHSVVLIVI